MKRKSLLLVILSELVLIAWANSHSFALLSGNVIPGGPPNPLANIKTGMIAHYDFDDATDSHNNYDWTPTGTPAYSGGEVTLTAATNTLSQDAGLSDVFAPSAAEGSASISVWFLPVAGTTNGEDIIIGNTNRILIEHLTSSVGFQGKINSLTADSPNSGVPADVWYHIAVTYDSATDSVETWVNGVSDGPTAVTYSAGAATNLTLPADGVYANMTFWNRKITSEEIAELHSLTKTLTYANFP